MKYQKKICNVILNKVENLCNNPDDCPFEEIMMYDENIHIRKLTLHYYGKYASTKCILLNEKNFKKLLNKIIPNGFINIYYKGNIPQFLKTDILKNNNFNYQEYCTNKEFSVFFPKDNLNSVYYYYSKIKKKSFIKTTLLKIIIIFNLYYALCPLYSDNKSLVVQRKSENNTH